MLALQSLGLLTLVTKVEAAATPVITSTIDWNPNHDCAHHATAVPICFLRSLLWSGAHGDFCAQVIIPLKCSPCLEPVRRYGTLIWLHTQAASY